MMYQYEDIYLIKAIDGANTVDVFVAFSARTRREIIDKLLDFGYEVESEKRCCIPHDQVDAFLDIGDFKEDT